MSLKKKEIYNLNLRQYVQNFDTWCELFDASVKKRIENTNEKFFVGLSSGYDSGAIVCSLEKNNAQFTTCSVRAAENLEILQSRIQRLPESRRYLFFMSEKEFESHKAYVGTTCEFYRSAYEMVGRHYVVQDDKGSFGTSFICDKAKKDDFIIYMSGHGADEIYSDYGFKGKPVPGFDHCTIAGNYPHDLEDCFPWKNFNGYRMIDFAYKDESVGGSYGIEVRYPFLDRRLVQSFLNIEASLKNEKYKAPLYHYLTSNKYSFSEGTGSKVGFRATANLRKQKKKFFSKSFFQSIRKNFKR